MIEMFIDSWDLFAEAYITGWLVAALLGLMGVLVVARNQIFITAAITQTSMFGIGVAMWITMTSFGHWLEPHLSLLIYIHAIAFSIAAALITIRVRAASSREAITGWLYLAATAIMLVSLYHTPVGLREIRVRLSSSIIGSETIDIAVFAALLVISAGVVARSRQSLMLLSMDPVMAGAVGLPVRRWETGIALWFGLVIGVAIQSAGVLYTFGCLVLPTLVARNLCRRGGSIFWVAPLIATGTAVLAFIPAVYYDFPPAQMATVFLCLEVPIAWLGRKLTERFRTSS